MLQAVFDRSIHETNPARIHGLRYVVDAGSARGELWLLLNTEGERDGVILVLDGETGTLQRRIVLPGLGGAAPFAIDTRRDRLYLVVRDLATIVALGP